MNALDYTWHRLTEAQQEEVGKLNFKLREQALVKKLFGIKFQEDILKGTETIVYYGPGIVGGLMLPRDLAIEKFRMPLEKVVNHSKKVANKKVCFEGKEYDVSTYEFTHEESLNSFFGDVKPGVGKILRIIYPELVNGKLVPRMADMNEREEKGNEDRTRLFDVWVLQGSC